MSGTEQIPDLLDGQESVGELVSLLGHSSLRVRRGAVAALGHRDPSETLPAILQVLEAGSSASARSSATDILLRYGTAALSALAAALDPDRHRDRTIHLLAVLTRFPSRQTLEAVTPLALHDDPSVAAAAISCVGAIRDPSSVPVLMQVLARGARWQSFYAIDALGEIGHAAAVRDLVRLVRDPYYRRAVIRALGRIGGAPVIPPLVEALMGGNLGPDRAALTALGEMTERLRGRQGSASLVRRLQDEIAGAGVERIVPGLVEVLEGGPIDLRRHAASALGWSGRPEAIAPLVKALMDPQTAPAAEEGLLLVCVRHPAACAEAARRTHLAGEGMQRAIRVLGTAGGGDAESLLLTALRDEDPDVRLAALEALGRQAADRHIEVLMGLLEDSSAPVAEAAVRALLLLAARSPRLHDHVSGRVDGLSASPSPSVRCAALKIIARLGQDGGRHTLDLALHDPVPAVRRTAVALLAEDPDPDRLWRLSAALADEDPRVREEAVNAVGRLKDERARAVLLASLGDRSIWVRCRAARALASHSSPEVLAALEKAARSEVPPVRVAALEALAEVGVESRVLALDLASDADPEVRQAALRVLAHHGGSRSTETLARGLEDPVWSVRSAAAQGLGASASPEAFGSLSRALDREAEAVVRQSILRALFHLDREAALPFLLAALAERTVAETAVGLLIEGHRSFADELRAEWASSPDPATREGLAIVLEAIVSRTIQEDAGDSPEAPS